MEIYFLRFRYISWKKNCAFAKKTRKNEVVQFGFKATTIYLRVTHPVNGVNRADRRVTQAAIL